MVLRLMGELVLHLLLLLELRQAEVTTQLPRRSVVDLSSLESSLALECLH